jgi:hypothetical protein
MGFYTQVRIILEGTRFKGIDGYKPIPLTQKEEEHVTLIAMFLQQYYIKLAKKSFTRPGGIPTDEAIDYPDEDHLSKQIYKFLCNMIGYPTRLRDEDWYYVAGTFMEMDREPSVKAVIDRIFNKKDASSVWKHSKISVSLIMLLGGMSGWGRDNYRGIYNDLEKIKEIVRTGMHAIVGSASEFDTDEWQENGKFFRQLKKYRTLRTMKPDTQKHFGGILGSLNESFQVKINDKLRKFLTYFLNMNFLKREKYKSIRGFSPMQLNAQNFNRLFGFDPTRDKNKFYGNFYNDLQAPYIKHLEENELQAIRNIVGKNDITRYFTIHSQYSKDNTDTFRVDQLLSAIDEEDRMEKGMRILAIIFNAIARLYSKHGHKDFENYLFEQDLKPETQKHFGGIFGEL